MATKTEATKASAVQDILFEHGKDKASERGLRSILRALKVLGLSRQEQLVVLYHMDYVSESYEPYYKPFQPILDKMLPPA